MLVLRGPVQMFEIVGKGVGRGCERSLPVDRDPFGEATSPWRPDISSLEVTELPVLRHKPAADDVFKKFACMRRRLMTNTPRANNIASLFHPTATLGLLTIAGPTIPQRQCLWFSITIFVDKPSRLFRRQPVPSACPFAACHRHRSHLCRVLPGQREKSRDTRTMAGRTTRGSIGMVCCNPILRLSAATRCLPC